MHSGGMLAGWKFSNIKDGVFAEYFHVNDADGNLAHLPDGLDPACAVMLSDMVPTGFHGAELAGVQYGDSVCVIGIGPVGLMAVAAAQLKGAARLFAVGSRPNCVAAARHYGATDIVSYRSGSISAQILEATSGRGVDRVIIAGIRAHPALGMGLRHGPQDHYRRSDARWAAADGKAGRTAAIRPSGHGSAAHAPSERL